MEYLSTFLLWFKIVSAIVSVVFLFLSIQYIIKTDVFGGYKKYKLDVRKYGGEEKKHFPDRWKKEVLGPIQSQSPEDWKQAVLHADDMLDDVLKSSGYSGVTIAERLQRIDETQLANINSLRDVHSRVFSSINAEQEISREDAKELLREYREALKSLGYL